MGHMILATRDIEAEEIFFGAGKSPGKGPSFLGPIEKVFFRFQN